MARTLGQELKSKVRNALALAALVLAGPGLAACSGEDEAGDTREQAPEFGEQREALTAEQTRVLGFESAVADWTVNVGSRAASTNVTQGVQSIAVSPNGWTEVRSRTLSSLGPVDSVLSFDLRVPSIPAWGEVRAIIAIPSLGITGTDIGGRPLNTLPAGAYAKVAFNIPAVVETALEGTYTDLRIKLVINSPTSAQPYLIDNLAVTGAAPIAPTPVTFVVTGPTGVPAEELMLFGADNVLVDDRVILGVSGKRVKIGQSGSSVRTEFGADTDTFGDVRTNASAFLRERARIRNDFYAGSSITTQNGVQINGLRRPNTPSTFATAAQWNVTFANGVEPILLPEDATRTLAPGAYGRVDLKARAVLTLRTGTYYFESFNTEPTSQVILQNTDGFVQIYSKNQFRYLGKFVETSTVPGRLVVGYLGASVAFLQAPFAGTMVAPNAIIELQRPTSGQHKGAWFGKRVHAFSNQTILHIPFDDSFMCPAGDRDGDKVNDCEDLCSLDPAKTEPGVCRCGIAETDTDGDTVPDCVDSDPTDPTSSTPSQCDHAAPGAACTDSPCPGTYSCTAGGVCGDPTDCQPDTDCELVSYGARDYWICRSPRSFDGATARCDEIPGRALVRIETPAENAELMLALAGLNIDDAWIGANDQTVEGQWRWPTPWSINGTQFWQGDSAGQTVGTGYARWAAGEPGTQDCAILNRIGGKATRWEDRGCGETHAYICEQGGPGTRLEPIPRPPGDVGEFFPEAEVPDEDNVDCIDPAEVTFAETPAQIAARLERCRDCTDDACRELECTGAPDNQQVEACEACAEDPLCAEGSEGENCACIQTNCIDAAAEPVNPTTCPAGSASQEALCKLATIDPSGSCSLSVDPVTFAVNVVDNCVGGSRCGRVFRCADLVEVDQKILPLTCVDSSECPAGHACEEVPAQNATLPDGASRTKVCINPDLEDPCDAPADPLNPGRCTGFCFGRMACGQPDPSCIFGEEESCEELKICEPEQEEPALDPGSDLTTTPFDPVEQFGEEVPPQASFPPDEPCEPSERDGSGACPDFPSHRWCHFDVPTGPFADPKGTQPDDKAASRDGGLVSFDFDPELKLDYKLTPAAFTAGDFGLEARAALTASTSFDLGPASGTFTIVDAVASAVADRCRFNTLDTKLEIFGIDFLPELGIDATFDTAEGPSPIIDYEACTDAIGEWTNAVDRAKKAMKDAQQLLAQFKDLKAQGATFSQSLCNDLLAEAPEDFKALTGGEPNCTTEQPIQVVNRFVDYYNQTAFGLEEKLNELSGTVLNINQTVPLPDYSNGHTQTIFSAFFFIGPVPATLEVAAFINYGVRGSLYFEAGADLLAIAKGYPSQLAKVTGTAEPFANAGITLFVGVGFDLGFASFSAGVEGAVTLGEVSLPTYASAALIMAPEEDERPTPDDILAVATEQPAFPLSDPQQYRIFIDFGYGMGASVQNILAGRINARLRVKFLFFSKTWRATLLSFNGFNIDPNPIPLLTGAAEVDILGNLELPTALDNHGWGTMQMPMPFLVLPRLSSFDLPAPPSGGGPIPTEDFDTDDVTEMFYDRLCLCRNPPEACQNEFDCCEQPAGVQPLLCFSDPEIGGATVCSTCRGDTDSCNDDDDCCDEINGQEGVCADRDEDGDTHCQACVPHGVSQQVEVTCLVDDECCRDGAVCNLQNDPLSGDDYSFCCFPNDQECALGSECCTGNCEDGQCADEGPPR